MLTADGPKLVEYNVRFGDPEAQVVLPRLDAPTSPSCSPRPPPATSAAARPAFTADAAVCVVLASEGYPEGPRTGDAIDGLDAALRRPGRRRVPRRRRRTSDGALVTAGGRVLERRRHRSHHRRGPPPGLRRGRPDLLARYPPSVPTSPLEAATIMSKVAVLMGSPNDADKMKPALARRSNASASRPTSGCCRRTARPAEVAEFASRRAGRTATPRSSAAPGWPPTSPAPCAAHTTLPVVGVPLSGGALNGVDALYATVQMPKGIPVATVAVDGAMNAALLVVQMLAITDEDLADKLAEHRAERRPASGQSPRARTSRSSIQDFVSLTVASARRRSARRWRTPRAALASCFCSLRDIGRNAGAGAHAGRLDRARAGRTAASWARRSTRGTSMQNSAPQRRAAVDRPIELVTLATTFHCRPSPIRFDGCSHVGTSSCGTPGSP